MIKRRIWCTVLVICLLFAVGSAAQDETDAFKNVVQTEECAGEPAERGVRDERETERTEEEAEGGQDTERTEDETEGGQETGQETGQAAEDALYLCKGSARLAEMVEEQSEALQGYASFLQEFESERQGSGGEEEPGFALLYLDGDDVPELVVMAGTAHVQGASVYTFWDGKVNSLGSFGQYGTMLYREKEGILFHDYDNQGNVHSWVYQIEGDHLVVLQSYDEGITEDGEESAYWVDGEEVTEEQYRAVSDKWHADGYQRIQYDDCRKLSGTDIQKSLQEELEARILMQEEVLKQNLLITAGARESDILLFDYDDYDGDGRYEAFMIAGRAFDDCGIEKYDGRLYFAGADGRASELDVEHDIYRMIDGKMDFGSRKYLFFYLNYNLTANISVIWTVEDGKPVEISESVQRGQVVYRGGDDFEIVVDGYDHYCEKECIEEEYDMWTGHTWKPYFYHYSYENDRLEPYAGKEISAEAFKELSGADIIEEIEAEGYTVGEIIHWENDIVTINYHYVETWGENDSREKYVYENVIWDNRVKDYWRKDERHVTSWENAGVEGIYYL